MSHHAITHWKCDRCGHREESVSYDKGQFVSMRMQSGLWALLPHTRDGCTAPPCNQYREAQRGILDLCLPCFEALAEAMLAWREAKGLR